MPDGLAIGQRIQTKVAYSEADWYSTHIEDLTDTELVIGAPIKGGELVSISLGTLLDCQFPMDDAFYAFQAEVLDRRTQPLPILVLRRPDSVQRFQRRRLFRLPVVLPAVVTPTGSKSVIRGTTLDLSGGGFSLLVSEPIELDTELELRVNFPDGWQLASKGRVVKVGAADSTEAKPRYAHGIEFVDLPAGLQEKIVSFIFAEQRERRRREVGRW
jgi:c-di-GMP-binding flagellar brake protein YcgR